MARRRRRGRGPLAPAQTEAFARLSLGCGRNAHHDEMDEPQQGAWSSSSGGWADFGLERYFSGVHDGQHGFLSAQDSMTWEDFLKAGSEGWGRGVRALGYQPLQGSLVFVLVLFVFLFSNPNKSQLCRWLSVTPPQNFTTPLIICSHLLLVLCVHEVLLELGKTTCSRTVTFYIDQPFFQIHMNFLCTDDIGSGDGTTHSSKE